MEVVVDPSSPSPERNGPLAASGFADVVAASPPGAWRVLGHAPALLRDPLSLLASAGRLGPVAIARLGPVRAYLVTEPGMIRSILVQDAADYDKGFQFDTLRSLIGDGVSTSGGAAHRRNKKLERAAFDHSAVDRYALEMAGQTADFLDSRWARAAADRTVVDAAAEMRMLAMRAHPRTPCPAPRWTPTR